jgi:hypothetical protein
MLALAGARFVKVRGAERLRAAGLRTLGAALLAGRPLSEALAALDGPRAGEGAGEGAGDGRVERALRRWPTTCLYRALAGYAELRAAGEDVRFVIGVRVDGGELRAHAWLERQETGSPLGEPEDPRRLYAVAFAHPSSMGRPAEEIPAVIPPTSPRPSPDALLTELADGTGVLLDLKTKFYFQLNRTGVAVWKALAAGKGESVDAIVEELARAFEGTPPGARADVEALLRELADEGLLLPPVAPPGPGPGSGG